MSGVPSAFILVVVVDRVTVGGAGTVLVVVVLDELLLIVVVAGVVVWAWAERLPTIRNAARRVRRRFIKNKVGERGDAARLAEVGAENSST